MRYVLIFVLAALPACSQHRLEWLTVTPDGKGFQTVSGQRFVPWGFNYDHDEAGRLIEDYWEAEWPKIEQDLAEMKELGANIVRIHIQFGRFMIDEQTPNRASLGCLRKLVKLADRTGLYLDLTGLGCYHKKDVPAWYDGLDEDHRWAAQARFWEAVAETCQDSPAVFFYDLMNEPVVPGEGKRTDWLGPPLGDKHFVQFVTLDLHGRSRPDVGRAWARTLAGAIRRHDRRHPVTAGLIANGFMPPAVINELDLVCVHLYPEGGKIDRDIQTLRSFSVGKPLIVEETFTLSCSLEEFDDFIRRSKGVAAGWIGFYWGKTPAQLAKEGTISAAVTQAWLDYFTSHKP